MLGQRSQRTHAVCGGYVAEEEACGADACRAEDEEERQPCAALQSHTHPSLLVVRYAILQRCSRIVALVVWHALLWEREAVVDIVELRYRDTGIQEGKHSAAPVHELASGERGADFICAGRGLSG